MSIYFLANNIDVIKLVNNINFNENDLLITYNKCQHLYNIPKVYNHNNRIHIIRAGNEMIHYDSKISKYLNNCKKIYIIGNLINNEYINKYILNIINNYNIIDISKEKNIYEELIKMKFLLKNNKKEPQTGLLSYLYLKTHIKDFNNKKKYLFGFTNDYTNEKLKLWRGHSKELEQTYYQNELLIDSNLVKIDK